MGHKIAIVRRPTVLQVAGLAWFASVLLAASAGAETTQSRTAAVADELTQLTIEISRTNSRDPEAGMLSIGSEARRQLVVTGRLRDGRLLDYTRLVKYESAPKGLVAVDETGLVTPLANGAVRITAKAPQGLTFTTILTFREIDTLHRINFPNQIVPIFTKSGCNSGGCHGRAAGQNGFRLSLLGFEPREDFEHLVIESRGRRLFPAAPGQSLLLLKATASLPHGGGQRVDKDSPAFELLYRWIQQGMPYGEATDPKVVRIEVLPDYRLMSRTQTQQLAVTATYSDGSTEDVTRLVQYEPNDKDMAEVSKTGFVRVAEQAGQVAVMVRFQDQVAVFCATIPHGVKVQEGLTVKNFIDELVLRQLQTLQLPPSQPCDDATFIRRVTIDIAGRLPTPAETRSFLSDPDSRKRQKWIDFLLASPEYAGYFANKWNAILRNKRRDETSVRGNFLLYAWIRQSLRENKPYDRLMREIVTASGDIGRTPPVTWFREVQQIEDQVQDTAQIFLGVRLQCARCHHHPFEKWSQQDYYGFSAFFSRLGRKPGNLSGEQVVFHERGTAAAINPRTKLPVKPTALGSAALDILPDQDPREALADWIASKENPFFARMLVNRYWKHFFSRGLVEPEDDMRMTNPPTNPELLGALARHFIGSGYDLKELIRTICRSQTYQLSSYPNSHNARDSQNFSRYYAKRLNAEVLLDAIDQVTGVQTVFPGQPEGTRAVQLPDNSFNTSSYFLALFGRPNNSSASESERTDDANLAQSLHLLNSQKIQEKLDSQNGRAVLLAKDASRTDEDKVRELYCWAYSREPDSTELKMALSYLQSKSQVSEREGTRHNRRLEAYQDTLWALINTKEFLFNH
ncbi:MAG: DUF1553 domain-containing protein [Acidobacteria bacterium]|nr:DUF1553 domain-containing protein [Acidobacteriota bacterium]